ncbi:hypothetical protein BJY52DRAFT_1418880 [Lactarius psammicola]|nr:hypothetical protein BJY52DRAFT_1418880 [Lactarius psammicola]
MSRPSAAYPLLPAVLGDRSRVGTRGFWCKWTKLSYTGNYNFTGLAGNKTIKMRVIETPWIYGVGSCGPPRFNGTIDGRFVVTEGTFEKVSGMVDLPKLIELKHKYKYRLVLDESISFGTVDRTGGHQHPLEHAIGPQRAVGESARDPGGVRRVEAVTIPSQTTPQIIHTHLRSATTLSPSLSAKSSKLANPALRKASSFDIADKERLLQDIRGARAGHIDDACVAAARAGARWASVSLSLSCEECERTPGIIKAAVAKVLAQHK